MSTREYIVQFFKFQNERKVRVATETIPYNVSHFASNCLSLFCHEIRRIK